MKTSQELERQAALNVAALMAAAARTAPKTRGIDNISVLAVDDPETKGRVIAKMQEISKRDNLPFVQRDANCIANAPVLLVIGVADNPPGLDCGFCGHKTCVESQKAKSTCAFNSIDLGIAVSSAAATAGQFHVDNRVMFSIGRACRELRLFGESVRQILGIPLSISGKSPFFDRK
ncbi:MAG: DUF2148 domain-containing protein [Verrucomicrobiae bacterium]|nr:DUF2148 domain-containing protein [Verrucomicrobiae bacterium]